LSRIVHWFRRDLRLHDNSALAAAADAGREVVPVYVLSQWQGTHGWTGPHRQQFLCDALGALDEGLRALGSRLIFREGDPIEALAGVIKEAHAETVYFNRDPDPHGREIEKRLEQLGRELGIAVGGFQDVCLHEREEVLNASGAPYRVFTPYARAWTKLDKPRLRPAPRALATPKDISSLPRPKLSRWGLPRNSAGLEASEGAARQRWRRFLAERISAYSDSRDLPAAEGTSRLSQDLRHGLISIREIFSDCESCREQWPAAQRAGVEKFVSELIWREFYSQILWHFPEVLEWEFQEKFRGMSWPGTKASLMRWQSGETGFPLVDAGMRELQATGFMANRVRMVTAMFLTKDLQVDWRWGEKFFLQLLTDGEIASNNGGWQWCAGTGADAAPYFRIQNPWTQASRHDSNGEYIRRWVPELRDLPVANFFHPPVEGARLASKYPRPMVDHAEARARTLDLFAHQSARFSGKKAPQ